jgi:outer membrane lipoprotein-sorting protein
MNAITAWVRRASATTLTAVGLSAAVVFVGANWAWTIDRTPAKPPPPTTLAELTLRELSGAGPAGVTAHFRYVDSLVPTTNLVPDATAGGSPLPLVSGADGRLWYANGRLRMEFQTDQGDTQLLLTGNRALVYDAADGTAYSAILPVAGVPQLARSGLEGASGLLRSLSGDAAISQPRPGVTGGRPAYTVRIAPTHDGGLLRSANLAVDAETGTPLRLELYGVGKTSPLVEFALSDVSYGEIEPSVFRLRLPFGMRPLALRFAAPPSVGGAVPCQAPKSLAGLPLRTCREASRSTDVPGRVLVYGTSLASVVVLEQPGASDPGGGLWSLLPSVSVSGSSGRELVTELGTVVRFVRGGVTYTVLGSMPRPVVEAVARGL